MLKLDTAATNLREGAALFSHSPPVFSETFHQRVIWTDFVRVAHTPPHALPNAA